MELIHVLCTTDDSFALPYGVMLTSLFENNKDSQFCIWILCSPLSEKNIAYFRETTTHYGADLHFIVVGNNYYGDMPLKEKDRMSNSLYYRLFAAELLPQTVSKVLSLDGDIIVLSSLKDLWCTSIDNFALEGVVDFNYNTHTNRLSMSNKYINAGVLLMNLDFIRKNHLVEKFKERLAYIDNHRDENIFHDQDIFNYVCDKSIKHISIRYNLLTPFLLKGVNLTSYEEESKLGFQIKNCIIHYAGYPKPWVKHYYDHPFRAEWLYYYNISRWNKENFIKYANICRRLTFPFLRILYNLKIIKRQTRFRKREDLLYIK